MPSFHYDQVGDWHVLHVSGELDMATAPTLRQQVVALVSHGAIDLVINLDGVEFIDSTGLGVLVGAVKRIRTAGGELRVVCSRKHLLSLFEITRLTRILDLFDSVEAATEQPPNSRSEEAVS